jgi:hypothetical protein
MKSLSKSLDGAIKMSIQGRDIVLIIKGEDFDGNSLVGKRARINNILTPNSKDVYIRVIETNQVLFFPKEWLKVVER